MQFTLTLTLVQLEIVGLWGRPMLTRPRYWMCGWSASTQAACAAADRPRSPQIHAARRNMRRQEVKKTLMRPVVRTQQEAHSILPASLDKHVGSCIGKIGTALQSETETENPAWIPLA